MSRKFLILPVIMVFSLLLTAVASSGAAPLPQNNWPTPTFTPTYDPMPNLKISSGIYRPDPTLYCYPIGAPLGANVYITNKGGGQTGAFNVALTIDGRTLTRTVNGMSGYETTSVWFGDSGISTQPVTFVVDVDGQVTERRENDNTFTEKLETTDLYPPLCETPTPSPVPDLPDLETSWIVYGNEDGISCQENNEPVGVLAQIRNNGTQAAGPFTVKATLWDMYSQDQNYTRDISGLAVNETVYLWFPEFGVIEDVFGDVLSVMTDVNEQVEEITEMNNRYNIEDLQIPSGECTPVQGNKELLENGNFELGEARTVSNWTSSNLKRNDARVCTSDAVHGGQCAFQFKGSANQARILLQKITPNISSGMLTFSGWIETENLQPGAKLIMQVRYKNGTRERVVVRPQLNSTDYTYFAEQYAVRNKVASIKILVKAAQGGGLFRVDDLSVNLDY